MSKALKEIQNMRAELTLLMKTKGEAALREVFQEFFKANPEVTGIAWAQFAPHFNDGDACTFSVHSFCLSLEKEPSLDEFNGYGGDEGDGDEGDGRGWLGEYAGLARDLQEKLDELEGNVKDDELFEMIWGNGYKVMVTPNGQFETEDHDHD